MKTERTITEALASSPVFFRADVPSNSANVRQIPYSEIYRGATAAIETPLDRLQRAVDDERRRLRAQ